jgi:hypothetical protein
MKVYYPLSNLSQFRDLRIRELYQIHLGVVVEVQAKKAFYISGNLCPPKNQAIIGKLAHHLLLQKYETWITSRMYTNILSLKGNLSNQCMDEVSSLSLSNL